MLSDLLSFLQEAQQGCVVGPLLLLGPSGLQQLLLELLLAVFICPVCSGAGPLQRRLHQACNSTAGKRGFFSCEHWATIPKIKKLCGLRTFDPGDGVLAVLGLVLRSLSLGRVLHRMLVHARVSRQQAHVVLLAVIADGPPVSERLLHREVGV